MELHQDGAAACLGPFGGHQHLLGPSAPLGAVAATPQQPSYWHSQAFGPNKSVDFLPPCLIPNSSKCSSSQGASTYTQQQQGGGRGGFLHSNGAASHHQGTLEMMSELHSGSSIGGPGSMATPRYFPRTPKSSLGGRSSRRTPLGLNTEAVAFLPSQSRIQDFQQQNGCSSGSSFHQYPMMPSSSSSIMMGPQHQHQHQHQHHQVNSSALKPISSAPSGLDDGYCGSTTALFDHSSASMPLMRPLQQQQYHQQHHKQQQQQQQPMRRDEQSHSFVNRNQGLCPPDMSSSTKALFQDHQASLSHHQYDTDFFRPQSLQHKLAMMAGGGRHGSSSHGGGGGPLHVYAPAAVVDMKSLTSALIKAQEGTGEVANIILNARFCPRLPGLTKLIGVLSKQHQAWRKALEVYGCVQALGLEADTALTNAAISACDRGGQWETALQLWMHMEHRDNISYSAMISALAKGKQWSLALEVFCYMMRAGCCPDVITCCSLISALDKGSYWQLAERVFVLMWGECLEDVEELLHASSSSGTSPNSMTIEPCGLQYLSEIWGSNSSLSSQPQQQRPLPGLQHHQQLPLSARLRLLQVQTGNLPPYGNKQPQQPQQQQQMSLWSWSTSSLSETDLLEDGGTDTAEERSSSTTTSLASSPATGSNRLIRAPSAPAQLYVQPDQEHQQQQPHEEASSSAASLPPQDQDRVDHQDQHQDQDDKQQPKFPLTPESSPLAPRCRVRVVPPSADSVPVGDPDKDTTQQQQQPSAKNMVELETPAGKAMLHSIWGSPEVPSPVDGIQQQQTAILMAGCSSGANGFPSSMTPSSLEPPLGESDSLGGGYNWGSSSHSGPPTPIPNDARAAPGTAVSVGGSFVSQDNPSRRTSTGSCSSQDCNGDESEDPLAIKAPAPAPAMSPAPSAPTMQPHRPPLRLHHRPLHGMGSTTGGFKFVNTICCNALLSAYANASPPQWKRALLLLSAMQQNQGKIAADCVAYNTVMKACRAADRLSVAYKVFGYMMESRVEPSIATFNTMISAALSKQDYTMVVHLWNKMGEAGVDPSAACANAAGVALDQLGQSEAALPIFQALMADPKLGSGSKGLQQSHHHHGSPSSLQQQQLMMSHHQLHQAHMQPSGSLQQQHHHHLGQHQAPQQGSSNPSGLFAACSLPQQHPSMLAYQQQQGSLASSSSAAAMSFQQQQQQQ